MKLLELVKFNLSVNKKQIIGWCIALFSFMFLYMILFPSVKDMAQVKLDAMPQELLQFVGISDMADMGNYVIYFGMIYNLILVAMSIFAVIFTSNLLYNEEKTKTIEFMYSLEVNKYEIYFSKLITSYLAIMLVVIATCSSAIICGYIGGGETFILMDILSIMKFSSISPFVFLSIGLMISGITAKVSGATVGSMVVLLSYILGFLSEIVSESLSWLKYFSPFQIFSPDRALTFDNDLILMAGIYFMIMVVAISIGAYFYNKRDYVI